MRDSERKCVGTFPTAREAAVARAEYARQRANGAAGRGVDEPALTPSDNPSGYKGVVRCWRASGYQAAPAPAPGP